MLQSLESPKRPAAWSGWLERRISNPISSHKLRYIRIDRNLYIPANAIDEFLAANMVKPKGGEAA